MHHALAIANTPDETWAEQIQRLSDVCPNPAACGKPHSCRERNAAYLRMQYRMKRRRDNAKAVRA